MRIGFVIMVSVCAVAPAAAAVDSVAWRGDNWSLDTNWDPRLVPKAIDDIARIEANMKLSDYYGADTPYTIGQLHFQTKTSAITLSNTTGGVATLTIDVATRSALIYNASTGAGNREVKVAVQLNDNTDLENRGTGLLSFLKPIRSGSSTTGINIVAAPVAANFCVFGAVNTYTGSTVINGSIVTGTSAAATYYGRLRTTVSGALPSTTTLDITGNTTGGYLDLYGTVQTVKQLSSSGTNPALARISNTAASAATLAVSSTAVDSVFGGVISDGAGVVGLTKSGAGTRLTLTAAQTYTGATVVSGGVLRVNGSLGATPVTIEGGTLEGTGDGVTSGLIGGAVRVGNGLLASGLRDARLAPGNSVGTLAVASASFAEDGALAIEISDAGAGLSDGGCDLLLVGGALDLRGAALELSTTGALNDSAYIVARYGSLVGEFASVSGLPAGYTLDYHYEGNQIALLVPEPGALGLLAGGFLLLRRRRG